MKRKKYQLVYFLIYILIVFIIYLISSSVMKDRILASIFRNPEISKSIENESSPILNKLISESHLSKKWCFLKISINQYHWKDDSDYLPYEIARKMFLGWYDKFEVDIWQTITVSENIYDYQDRINNGYDSWLNDKKLLYFFDLPEYSNEENITISCMSRGKTNNEYEDITCMLIAYDGYLCNETVLNIHDSISVPTIEVMVGDLLDQMEKRDIPD